MSLSHQDVRNILNILDHAAHLESIDLTIGEFRLQASKPGAVRADAAASARPLSPQHVPLSAAGPAALAQPTANPVAELAALEIPAGMVAVCAPMLGTFYARPSPEQPSFVGLGDTVQAEDTVGLVEVMKMFNSVKAGVTGVVQRIVAESGKPVRQGQVLLLIAPTPQG
jgi:acetyl-CoA carboxylase biotin carboxyl carrier protein